VVLPRAVREVTGVAPTPAVHVPMTPSWRERMARTFGTDLVESTSASDLALISDVFYAMTTHSVEMAIRAFSEKEQIIALERHPAHNISAWDGPLQWLDDAYREFRLRQGEIMRLVVLENAARQNFVDNKQSWNDWVTHIRHRLVTDKVRVVLEPLAEWNEAISRDLLILPDTLVVEFEQEDFPFSCSAHRGRAVLAITAAANAIVKCRDQRHVFSIENARNEKCFEQLFGLLEASVRGAEGGTERRAARR
jgi:hypothetical protein